MLIPILFLIISLLLYFLYLLYRFYIFKKSIDINKDLTYSYIRKNMKNKEIEDMKNNYFLYILIGINTLLFQKIIKHILQYFNTDFDSLALINQTLIFVPLLIIYFIIVHFVCNSILSVIIKRQFGI